MAGLVAGRAVLLAGLLAVLARGESALSVPLLAVILMSGRQAAR